jgi:N6-L-threonylcarbamoyladenine synthase
LIKYAKEGDPGRFHFPEPQIPGLNFSFSGLKTSILYFLQNAGKTQVYKEESIALLTSKKNSLMRILLTSVHPFNSAL